MTTTGIPPLRQERDLDGFLLYCRDIAQHSLVSHVEACELARRAQRGDVAARDRLATANLRLVISVAKKYWCETLSLDDRVQEGNLGLLKAIERFDAESGYKFSTYATWWIRQAIGRAVETKSRFIQVPVHVSQKLREVERAAARLRDDLDREPTVEEIAEEAGYQAEEVTLYLQAVMTPASLDRPLSSHADEKTLADVLEAPALASGSALSWHQQEQQGRVLAALESLPYRERTILILRHGIGTGGEGQSLQTVGNVFGVSRERIRQIEAKAMRHLQAKLAMEGETVG